ncbi:hypothetical protein [Lentzea terrae]|uniref:hypothetical protein n=1 Tax=Lentzea terrae TaxID=2200761 RepID=UPI0013009A30|nr:hypothetical protein [Lentzea terrae]
MSEPERASLAEVFAPPAQQQPAAAPAAPVRSKKTAVVVLAVIAALLFCATGVSVTFFLIVRKNAVEMVKVIEQQDREITDLWEKAEASEEAAAKARNERETTRFEIARADKCRLAAKAYKEASFTDDQAKLQATWNEIYLNC